MGGEIIIVPFHDPGHTFPATELSLRLASRGHHITLFLPSPSSSSPSILRHPLIQIMELSARPPPPQPPVQHQHQLKPKDDSSVEKYLSESCSDNKGICAIVDVMMSHLNETFKKYDVSVVSFFTSSATSAALEHAVHKLSSFNVNNLPPTGTVTIPGLPDDMAVTVEDLTHKGPSPPPPPPFHTGHGGGFAPPPPVGHHGPPPLPSPPGPSTNHGRPPPPWIRETDGSIALIFNTCDELERPFLNYIAKETQKPVFGIGPLLPAQFWAASGSVVRDETARPKLESTINEAQVLEWLDSKPRRSVLYIAFGTLMGPSDSDLAELADALGDADTPFIWVLKASSSYFPEDLASRAKGRGLVIKGWAPQLLILSHHSTGGFLSHCGWNSTTEALGCGVPMLTWPIKGDQFYNAKLVAEHLKVGRTVRTAGSNAMVTKDDVASGIEALMRDEEMRARATSVRSIFSCGFPKSSCCSLDSLVKLLCM